MFFPVVLCVLVDSSVRARAHVYVFLCICMRMRYHSIMRDRFVCVYMQLAPSGCNLLPVAATCSQWLQLAPSGCNLLPVAA